MFSLLASVLCLYDITRRNKADFHLYYQNNFGV